MSLLESGESAGVSIPAICGYVLGRYPGVALTRSPDGIGLFYNPYDRFPAGIHVLSFTEKDGPKDRASNLEPIPVGPASPGGPRGAAALGARRRRINGEIR